MCVSVANFFPESHWRDESQSFFDC